VGVYVEAAHEASCCRRLDPPKRLQHPQYYQASLLVVGLVEKED
jgi:hypothetical protein